MSSFVTRKILNVDKRFCNYNFRQHRYHCSVKFGALICGTYVQKCLVCLTGLLHTTRLLLVAACCVSNIATHQSSSKSLVSVLACELASCFSDVVRMRTYLHPGLWSRYTKAPTPTLTPRFLKLRLRLLHKSSICINNGKPIRRFIATT
jgi:hypothetical protein